MRSPPLLLRKAGEEGKGSKGVPWKGDCREVVLGPSLSVPASSSMSMKSRMLKPSISTSLSSVNVIGVCDECGRRTGAEIRSAGSD